MPNDNGKLSRVQGFLRIFVFLREFASYLNDWVSWVGAGWLFSFSVAAKGLSHTPAVVSAGTPGSLTAALLGPTLRPKPHIGLASRHITDRVRVRGLHDGAY
jgi:hypothetical protein